MSRIVRHTLGLLLVVGIAGCGNSEKPATSTPEPDKQEMQKQMDQQKKFQEESQKRGQ